jgi:hypothetical protein
MRYTIPAHDDNEEIVIETHSFGIIITQKHRWGETHFIEVGAMQQEEELIKMLMDINGG